MEKILLETETSLTLAELLELTKGHDPAKVVLDTSFEVPDWVTLTITIKD